MKMSPDAMSHHDNAIAIPNHQVAVAFMQDDTNLPHRQRELPLGELISLLSAEKNFRVDLSFRVQVAGDAKEIEVPLRSDTATMPLMSGNDLFNKVRKALSASLDDELGRRNGEEHKYSKAETVRFGEIEVDFRRMELRRCGIRVQATAHEFKVLQYFLSRPEEVISREELLNQVWGYENYPTTRTVDNRILKLRQKLERTPSKPVHFLTVHGVGYKFVPLLSSK
jgi:DNA-binding winged helix-turn-helix (wHTH) protein